AGRDHVREALGVDVEAPVDGKKVDEFLARARGENRGLCVDCVWIEEADAVQAEFAARGVTVRTAPAGEDPPPCPPGTVTLRYPKAPASPEIAGPEPLLIRSSDLGH